MKYVNVDVIFSKLIPYDYFIRDNMIGMGVCCELGCPIWKIYIKKVADIIVFIPDDDSYHSLFDEGVLYTLWQEYEQMCKEEPQLPKYEDIPSVTKSDCAEIFWLEVPELFMLTYIPRKFNKKMYLNTDAPEGQKIITILESLLKAYGASNELVRLQKNSTGTPITIILDTPDYFEWKALCKVDGGYSLRLEPGYTVMLS